MIPMRKLLALSLAIVAVLASPPANADFENFISVDGDRLMDGTDEFRFIAFNVPTLFYVEDEMAFSRTNPYGLPSEFELRDLFRTVVETGGGVVRAYTVPVRNTNFPEEAVTYVEAPGQFNEAAFEAMDMALALAREYGVRVIIPLVNNWEWMGGRPNYAAFRGKTADEFWSDPQLIDDFKQTVAFVLNRRNTVTGVLYKDDKTIMAWETGNELQNTVEWAINIGAFIKSIDNNHLLIDGFHAIHLENHDVWVQDYSIESDHFDLINTHHYEPSSIETVRNLRRTVEMVDGRKPVFLGEFGFISTSGIEEILDYVIGEKGIPGALVWSLRRHHRGGGFYHHSEPVGYGLYRAYHWPGFDDGEAYDERNALRLIRKKAFEIRGKPVPPITPPLAPEIIPFERAPVFSWRGSAGGAGYDVQRSAAEEGPWKSIAYDIDDIDTPGFPLYSDTSAEPGQSYFYRVVARNESGVSPPSGPFGPVKIEYLTRVDKARNLGVLQDSRGVTVESGDYRSYKEAFSRLHGTQGGYVTYSAPGELLEIRLYTFENSGTDNSENRQPDIVLSTSVDAMTWKNRSAGIRRYPSSEKNYDYLVPAVYTLGLGGNAKYVKASFVDDVSIVRVELDYR